MLTSATQTLPTFAENTLLTTFTLCRHLLSTFFGVLCVGVGRGGGVHENLEIRGGGSPLIIRFSSYQVSSFEVILKIPVMHFQELLTK